MFDAAGNVITEFTPDGSYHAGLEEYAGVLRVSFSLTHSGFCRFLCIRFVWKYSNPDFSTSFNMTGHRTTRGLDLARSDALRLERLEAVGAEIQLGPALGVALHPAGVRLAVLGPLGHQHVLLRYDLRLHEQ